MKQLAIILGVLVLTLGYLIPSSDAAPVHNFDSNSLYTCSFEEPPDGEPSSGWVTRHSHPVALTEAYVDYSCCAWDGAREVRYWATLWWNGAHNAHGGYRYGVLGTDCF